jgi:putative restriction endonuclease
MPTRIFGNIPSVSEGAVFESRETLSQAGVHPPTQAGISGSEEDGADSIIVSGGYEDDEDRGDERRAEPRTGY